MKIFFGLSALLVFTPYSQADASGCCSATGIGTAEVHLKCPNGIEGKIRLAGKDGSESAALLRCPAVFEQNEDAGTYFRPSEQIATVTSSFDGSTVRLATFAIDGSINFLMSIEDPKGGAYVTSSIGGAPVSCERAESGVSFQEEEIPTGLSIANARSECSSPQKVYGKLFGL